MPGTPAIESDWLHRKLLRYLAVQINCFMELPLFDVLALSVRDVNRSWTDQQRFAPVGELRNVGGECGDHGVESVDGLQAQEGKLEGKCDLDLISGGRKNLPAQIVRWTDEAVEQVGMGVVGNDVGRAATLNQPNVQRAWPNLRIGRQWHGPQSRERRNQLVDRGLAQFRIRRMRHASLGGDLNPKSSFGSERNVIFRGLAVD